MDACPCAAGAAGRAGVLRCAAEGLRMAFDPMHRRRILIALGTMAFGLIAPLASAQVERYVATPASADGIGKRYMGREIAAVMGWQGGAWLEREEREREERTDLLLVALDLKPGMAVADIGAGTGYLSRRIAPAGAPGGRVLAVDVQPEMVGMLQALARQEGLTNIQASLGAEDDVKLP